MTPRSPAFAAGLAAVAGLLPFGLVLAYLYAGAAVRGCFVAAGQLLLVALGAGIGYGAALALAALTGAPAGAWGLYALIAVPMGAVLLAGPYTAWSCFDVATMTKMRAFA